MGSDFKIHKMHLPNVQASEFSLFPLSSVFNFISTSRSAPHLRASIRTSSPVNKLHSLSLSSSAEAAPVSLSEFPDEHSFVVSYLINSCGLPPELAFSRAKYVKFNSPGKPNRVLAFFKKHGFSETQVSDILSRYPQLLLCKTEKTLLPKLEFLSSLGLPNEEITDVISTAPLILRKSLEKVIPCYNLLRNLLESDDKTINVVKRYPMVLAHKPEVDNIQILQEVGVPPANIVGSMTCQHGGYARTAKNFRKIVEEVKEMGFDPSSRNFLLAIRTMRSMTKSRWENKVQVFKKYGWSDREILLAFEKNPRFIMSSEDKIMRVMDFLVNEIGVEATNVVICPGIIAMSLEKRIVPRCLLYQALLEKELSKNRKKLGIITLLSFTKKQFYDRVIKPYEDEAPEILSPYLEMLDS